MESLKKTPNPLFLHSFLITLHPMQKKDEDARRERQVRRQERFAALRSMWDSIPEAERKEILSTALGMGSVLVRAYEAIGKDAPGIPAEDPSERGYSVEQVEEGDEP